MRCRQAKAEGLEEGIRRGREEGLEEGLEKGMEKGMGCLGALITCLLDTGRFDDAKRVAEDVAYRNQLIAEFGLGAEGR